MRDRFEIVYVDARGEEQILSRAVPNGYSARWQLVKRHAARLLPPPVREARENPRGLTFVVASTIAPDDGFVGVRERI